MNTLLNAKISTVMILGCLAILPGSQDTQEPRRLTEAEHAKALAEKYQAEMEVVQWDRTRIDFVTPDHVIEIDFAKKWAEAIGQALYYAISDPSERTPAIILLMEPGEERFAHRCQAVCAQQGIILHIERVQYENR